MRVATLRYVGIGRTPKRTCFTVHMQLRYTVEAAGLALDLNPAATTPSVLFTIA